MSRKSGQQYFETVIPQLSHCNPSANLSCASLLRPDLSSLPKFVEPKTSMTKVSAISLCTSKIAHGRHKSQGPMRSEKVYHMTKLINQKCAQLDQEQAHIKQHYMDIDEAHA